MRIFMGATLGLGLVVHVLSGCVAKINIVTVTVTVNPERLGPWL
jgi:hypothetical protein